MTTTTRLKTFEYTTTTSWTGDRTGIIGSGGKTDVRVASPPEFKGIPGVWTPEDLYVAAIDLCHMTTFLAFAARKGIALKEYSSAARGVLEFAEGGYRFTKVVLSPTIVVGAGADRALVAAAVEEAHQNCLIGRSVTAEVEIRPAIITE
ncbi:MAG: OsmC family protein [Bacteroidota bacterium]